jgi:hypothetical protein
MAIYTKKGFAMEVSASTNTQSQTNTTKDPMKKAIDVQQQQVLKALDGLQEQSKQTQEMNAQKTGVGNSVNLLG